MKIKIFIYCLFLYLFVVPKFAFAYLDPGTGSYIFQIFAATVLGSTFFIKDIVKKVKQILKKSPPPTENNEK